MEKVLEEKNKEYRTSDELEELASKIMSDKLMDIPAKVAYVLVYPHINKTTAGRCIKANPMTKLFGDCDYVIQMSGNLWDQLDDERKEILMYHELLHIEVTTDKQGNFKYGLTPHDIEDFYVIIEKYGINWLQELKTLHASVYNLEESEMRTFKL